MKPPEGKDSGRAKTTEKTRVDVKICGLTNPDDALAALDCGADFLGFVLYPKSPRGITPEKLARIVDALDEPCKTIAVFVNETRRRMEKVIRDCGLYAVQIQGDEAPEQFMDMPVPVWRAVRFPDGVCRPAPAKWRSARYVIDAAVPGQYGGTGTLADWEKAAQLAKAYPVMLAGGLKPENVAAAIRAVRPVGVDVAGGTEAEPGRKDRARLRAFIRNAKAVELEPADF